VAPRGEDLRAGETALRRGVLLAPHEIALLAAAGRRTARVFDGPRIAYASTGCELREPGEALPRGCIRNSNAYGLAAQIRLARGRPEYAGVLPDEPGALRAGLAKGLEADLLVVSGGVSMGEHDLVPEVLAELGVRILFRRVRVRPGQPTLFGMRDRTLVFGLPGNPLSTLLGFDQYVLPAARIFRHHPQPLAALHAGRLSRSVSKRPGLTALLACGAEWSPEGCVLTPHPTHGSADIVSIRGAHAVAILPEEPAELPCGSTATFRRLYEP
jgi:molybdopterin molybdotransferase